MIGDTGRRAWPAVLGVGTSYLLLSSLMWEVDPTWGSAFWPAAGVSFAVLVRAPLRRWPAIISAVAIAEMTSNLLHGTTVEAALWGALANVIEPVIGAWIFSRVGRLQRLSGLESLAWLLGAGVIIGPAVGAAIGGVLAVSGPVPPLERWVRWWVGDGVGVLAVAPTLLAGRGIWRQRTLVETAALGAALIGTATMFEVSTAGVLLVAPSLVIPVLVWAALRYGVPGSALCLAVVALSVHWSTATGHGAFARAGGADLVAAQSFIGAIGLSILTVALLADDVAERRRAEAVLLHRATHDPLTGLANRSMLEMRVTDGPTAALALIDLDGFKAVNDTFGHLVGDEVLVEVGRRLEAACGPDDLVARIGGDEFAVVLATLDAADGLERFDDAIGRTFLLPVTTTPAPIPISASAGWATGQGTLTMLLSRADQHLYQRKRSVSATRRGQRDAIAI